MVRIHPGPPSPRTTLGSSRAGTSTADPTTDISQRSAPPRRPYIRAALDEPIQRGWRRFHVLTAKAEKRADKDVLLALLEFIGTVKIRNSPDFRKRRGGGRRRRYVEIEQPLHELSVGEWNW